MKQKLENKKKKNIKRHVSFEASLDRKINQRLEITGETRSNFLRKLIWNYFEKGRK